MGCIGLPGLPTRIGQVFAPVDYAAVAYLSAASFGDGLSIEPDLLPPIAA